MRCYLIEKVLKEEATKRGLESHLKGKGTYKDQSGNAVLATKDDPRVVSGELIGFVKGKPGIKSFQGKSHSQESKEKMSQAMKGKQSGEKNGRYGTCWITNEILKENKVIKKENLNEWIQNGWIKGTKRYT